MIRRDVNVRKAQEVQDMYVEIINQIEFDFGPDVWREIRTDDYWEKRDALPNTMEKQKFTIMRIVEWKREIKKNPNKF